MVRISEARRAAEADAARMRARAEGRPVPPVVNVTGAATRPGPAVTVLTPMNELTVGGYTAHGEPLQMRPGQVSAGAGEKTTGAAPVTVTDYFAAPGPSGAHGHREQQHGSPPFFGSDYDDDALRNGHGSLSGNQSIGGAANGYLPRDRSDRDDSVDVDEHGVPFSRSTARRLATAAAAAIAAQKAGAGRGQPQRGQYGSMARATVAAATYAGDEEEEEDGVSTTTSCGRSSTGSSSGSGSDSVRGNARSDGLGWESPSRVYPEPHSQPRAAAARGQGHSRSGAAAGADASYGQLQQQRLYQRLPTISPPLDIVKSSADSGIHALLATRDSAADDNTASISASAASAKTANPFATESPVSPLAELLSSAPVSTQTAAAPVGALRVAVPFSESTAPQSTAAATAIVPAAAPAPAVSVAPGTGTGSGSLPQQ
mgnify:CR=1 FL=1